MEFKIHTTAKGKAAELVGSGLLINDLDDAINLLGNASYQEADLVIIQQEHLHADFFKLGTGLAGDILQKFSNYRMKLAIVGDFSSIQSKSLRDFIFESNKHGQIRFIHSLDEAISLLK